MKYYLFLFCLFASSSSMAILGDDENMGLSSSSQSLTPLSAPCCSTDTPEPPFTELRTLNSPLEFDTILETPESALSGLKFNFTPTVDQLSRLTHQLPFIRNIDLSDTDVTNHEIRPLVVLKNLEHLDLSSTNVRNVGAVFNSQGQENASSELENNILRLSSHPNLSINLQYTIQTPLNAEGIYGDPQNVNTPEELYRILNHPGTRWGDLTLSFTPSLKQLQHIVITQPHLSALTLSGIAITDISPLSGLLELMELGLDDTPITDLSPLSALKELQMLYLNRTAVTDLSPLSGLLELKDLSLENTGVTDVSHLPDQLTYLRLKNTKITDASSLVRLTNLRNLDLSGTAVTDLSHLPDQLIYLGLRNTQITDLSSLVRLTNLREVHLRDTAITDVTPLADRYGLRFHTNIGILERGVTPTEIERLYSEEILKRTSPTAIPLTRDNAIVLQNIALRAADYLRSNQCTSNASPTDPLIDPLTDYLRSISPQYNSSLRSYDPKTIELCLQRARNEIERSPEIQKHIKDSKEFMNLSGNEGHYAAWLRADMLASIEGRLVMNGQHPSPNLFALAQTEFRFAEEEVQSKTHTKGFSEEATHMFQLLHLRYLCKYGIEPKPHIIEALKDVSYEVISRDSYATCAPQQRTCYLLGMADSLFRGSIFDLRPSRENLSSTLRYYNRPEEASCMLQTYERKTRLFPSLFERLWLQLSPGFSQEN